MADIYDIYKIKTPSTTMIAGPTGCGKSTMIKEVISRLPEVFDRPPERVIYCYSRDQSLYSDMKKNSPVPMEFVQGLPADFGAIPKRSLLIIDDLQSGDPVVGRNITDLFTKHSHHSDVDVVYLVQNLFTNTPHHRTCNLNSQYLIVFKNPRDRLQVSCLSRQVVPDNPKFLMGAYNDACARPHGYLFMDLKQATPEHLRFRDSIFPSETNFFVDKKRGLPLQLHT